MKYCFILFIINLLQYVFCYSQKWDGNDLIDDPKYYTPPSISVPALKSSSQAKILSVNVHFILRDDGTGNFAKDWDIKISVVPIFGGFSDKHRRLARTEGFKTTYYPCFYTNDQILLTNPINDNISYFARSITIPAGSNLNVTNNNGLFINAEDVEIHGEFTVDLGSVLIVNVTPHCN